MPIAALSAIKFKRSRSQIVRNHLIRRTDNRFSHPRELTFIEFCLILANYVTFVTMNKISDTVKELVENNALLHTGISQALLNLSQVARYLKPQIEARTKKSVKSGAILMALSRLSKAFNGSVAGIEISIENMIVHTDLALATYPNSIETHRAINAIYNKIQKRQGYITITQGVREVTLIFGRKHLPLISEFLPGKPLHRHNHIAALGIAFPFSYISEPGLFYQFYQQLYFQNITIIEQASTATELILYLDQDEVQLAFETLYNRFVRSKQRRD